MLFFETTGLLFVVLLGLLAIGIYGQSIEEAYRDRRRAQGDGTAHARATRKWMFVIFFPLIWPVALVIWIVKGIVHGLAALVGVFGK